MRTIDRLKDLLPKDAVALMAAQGAALTEVRLRSGRPVQVRCMSGGAMASTPLNAEDIGAISTAMMDYSVYAREDELGQGFFTMPDGCRVGVCGRVSCIGGRSTGVLSIGSMCIRVSREIRGCADALYGHALNTDGSPRSMLLLSRPGMGKTTLLRDLARQLSERGHCVAIVDERHELAACVQGMPTLDVGPCTDVMDGAPKAQAMLRLLRAMAPEVIVTDEIGSAEDAQAIAEAVRCGVAVIASAHAVSLESAYRRAYLMESLRGGCFEAAVVLGDCPGLIQSIHPLKCGEDNHAVCAGAVRGRRLHAVRKVAGPQRAQAG